MSINNMNLRQTIKKVLKENKQENILRKYINEFGIYDTYKMMGISFTKLVKISNIPIKGMIANDVLMENLENGNLTDTYKGFKIQSNLDGVVYWDGEFKTREFLNDYTIGMVNLKRENF